MSDNLDIKKISETNPKINMDQFREAEKLLRELHDQGLVKSRYQLAPPYGSRPLRARKESAPDSS